MWRYTSNLKYFVYFAFLIKTLNVTKWLSYFTCRYRRRGFLKQIRRGTHLNILRRMHRTSFHVSRRRPQRVSYNTGRSSRRTQISGRRWGSGPWSSFHMHDVSWPHIARFHDRETCSRLLASRQSESSCEAIVSDRGRDNCVA